MAWHHNPPVAASSLTPKKSLLHHITEIKTKHLDGGRLLNSLGIETHVNLPGVGENLGGQSIP
jgi:hypothetical protein